MAQIGHTREATDTKPWLWSQIDHTIEKGVTGGILGQHFHYCHHHPYISSLDQRTACALI
jgi:hypothetical protein